MSYLPLAPRYAKMLALGRQKGLMPFVAAVVAILSVRDPLIREGGGEVLEEEGGEGGEKGEEKEEGEGEGEGGKKKKKERRGGRVLDVHKKWVHPKSDILTSLFAVGMLFFLFFFYFF